MAVHILHYLKLVEQGVSIPLAMYRCRCRCRRRRQHRQTDGKEHNAYTTCKYKQYTDKVNNEQCLDTYTSRYVCSLCMCLRYLMSMYQSIFSSFVRSFAHTFVRSFVLLVFFSTSRHYILSSLLLLLLFLHSLLFNFEKVSFSSLFFIEWKNSFPFESNLWI